MSLIGRGWGTGPGAAVLAAILALPILPVARTDEAQWSGCAGDTAVAGAQCMTVDVPVDHADGSAEMVEVGVTRLSAQGGRPPLGTLLVLPGGPGRTADFALSVILNNPALDVLRLRFDIVSFDPRGVSGRGTRISCPDSAWHGRPDQPPTTTDEFEALSRANARLAAACRAESGPVLNRANAWETAGDVEAIWKALGVAKLSLIGLSYGSVLGQAYAFRYPEHIDRMVLDGVVDTSKSLSTHMLDEAKGEESAFLALVRDICAGQQSSTECSGGEQRFLAEYRNLLTTAQEGRLRAQDGRQVTARDIVAYVYPFLERPSPQARAVLSGLVRDPHRILGDLADFVPQTHRNIAYQAMACNDFVHQPISYPQFSEAQEAMRAAAPDVYPYTEFSTIAQGCVGWPTAKAWDSGTFSPALNLLLLGVAADPATPYADLLSVRARAPRSVMVTTDGFGHNAIRNSTCATEQAVSFLLAAKPPVSCEVFCPA